MGGQSFTAFDDNDNPVEIKIARKNERFKNSKGKVSKVNKDLTTKNIRNTVKQETVVLADEVIEASKYERSKESAYSHGWLDDNGKNKWEYRKTYVQQTNKSIWEATLNIAVADNNERILYDINPIKKVRQSVKSDTVPHSSVGQSVKSDTNPYSDSIYKNFKNVNTQKIKRSLKDDEEVDIKYSKKYNKGDNAFSKALTAEEWIKYNSAITTGVDVGLRINDHSMLVECEKGDYSYKLVIYDNTFEEKPIKAVYGIGNDSYSNTTIHKVAKVISDLEDAGYGRELIDKTLGNIRKNHQIILGRYSQQTGRYSKFRPVNFTSRANTQKQSNGGTVSSGTQKIGKQSLKDNTDVETSSIVDTSSPRYILSEALKETTLNSAERENIEKYQQNIEELDRLHKQ